MSPSLYEAPHLRPSPRGRGEVGLGLLSILRGEFCVLVALSIVIERGFVPRLPSIPLPSGEGLGVG